MGISFTANNIHNNDLLKKPSLRCLRGHVCPDYGCPRCRAKGRSRIRAQVLLWWRKEWTSPHLLQRIRYPQWTTLQRKRIQLPGTQWIQWIPGIQPIQWIQQRIQQRIQQQRIQQRIQQWIQQWIQQIPSPRLVTTDSQVYIESLNHLEDSSTDKLVNRHDYSYRDVIN